MPEVKLSPAENRLREQLVRTIASGQHPRYTPEQLWAAQGRLQLPPPPSNVEDYPVATGVPGLTSPIQQLQDPDPSLAFPMATAGPGAPDQPEPAASARTDKPYDLPKSPPKRPAKGKR